MAIDMVGRDVWVVQYEGDYPTVPRFAAEHRGFQVMPKKQAGPESWEEDRDQDAILMGATGTVVSVAGMRGDSPTWFDVRLDDGREVVLHNLQIAEFDYASCHPATLLENRSDSLQYERQWLYYLPLRLKDGARPTDSMGDWIDEKYLAQIALLDCTIYNPHPTLKSIEADQFRCVPVWKDGADVDPGGFDYETPREIVPTADMVEHATIEDLTR